jgi:hypothetical protein
MNAVLKNVVGCGMVALACLAGAAVAGPFDPNWASDTDTVDAYSTNYHDLYLDGGELINVRLQGECDADLDLFVYDENGNLIVSGTGYTDDEFVAFVPNSAGRFLIAVRNLGSAPCAYRLDIW